MNILQVGVDIAKNVFHVHAVDRQEKTVWQEKLIRGNWVSAIVEGVDPDTPIAMEACASAYHWPRELQERGYVVELIAAQFVKPYAISNKNAGA